MSELSPREKRSIDELYGILAEYRRDIDKIKRAQDTRLTTLGPNDAINFVDGEGKPVARIGGSGAYGYSSDLVQYLDGPIPDAPGEPLIEGGAGVIRVTLGDGAEPADARLCRVHASLDADFVPSYATVVGSLIPGTSTVAISIPAGTWYCCVQWLTLSGKESEVSPVVSVEVDAMVDMSDLDEVREEASQKWAEFAVREQEFRDAIASAEQQLETVQGILDQLPDPADFDAVAQQIQDAIDQIGNITERLQDAETALENAASKSELNQLAGNLSQLGEDLESAKDDIDAAVDKAAQVEAEIGPISTRLEAAETGLANAAQEASQARAAAQENAEAITSLDTQVQAAAKEAGDAWNAALEAMDAAITGGGNLYPDPSFELGGKGLDFASRWTIVEDSRARHGSHALRIETNNTGAIGFMTRHATWSPGNRAYVEAWIMRTSAAQTGGVRLRVRRIRSDTTDTGLWGNVGTLLDLSAVPVGEWVKISGQYTSTEANLVGLRAHVHVEGNGPVSGALVDSFRFLDITAAHEALTAAQAAQEAASSAATKATEAQATADGKSQVWRSTSTPVVSQGANGDVWWRFSNANFTGPIIGQWTKVSGVWQPSPIGSEIIAGLTVDKLLVTGGAKMPSAVIDTLVSDDQFTNRLYAHQVIVDPENFAPEPGRFGSAWSFTRASVVANITGFAGQAIALNNTETSDAQARGPILPVRPGETIYLGAQIGWNGTAPRAGSVSLRMEWFTDPNSARTGFDVAANTSEASLWIEGNLTVPAGVTHGRYYIYATSNSDNPGTRRIRSVAAYPQVGTTRITPGSVTAEKVTATREMIAKVLGVDIAYVNELIVAGNLFADHADLISAAMKNLTVTEKAQFAAAFAQEIWAELGVFDRLEAESAWIGGAMLGDGEIVARHITGSESLVTKILGFETAVADNLVLNQELWARSATIINAVMQTLSVTEKANFVDAFAETFWTNDFAAKVATIGRAIVSAPSLITDPDFQDVSTTAGEGGWWNGGGWQPVSVAWSDRTTFMRLSPDATGSGTQSITYGGTNASNASIPCQTGEEYILRFQVLRYVGWQASDDFQVRFAWIGKGSTLSFSDFSWSSVGNQAWAEFEATAPAGATHFYLWFRKTGSVGGARGFGDVTLKRKFGGEMLVDGTVQARKLQADEIWANSTWQNEAYFGSSDATYQTRVNGQGLEVLRTDDTGDRVPAVALGSGELGLTFWDEEGEPTGSITHDGYVSGDLVSAQRNVIIAGQPLVGALENIPDGLAILDAFPKGEIARGEQNMQNLSVSGTTVWLFMECDAAQVYQGRSYRIEVEPFSISEDVSMFLDFNYTLNGSHPHGGTANAGTLRSADRTFQGSLRFTPPTDGLLRIGPKIRRASSGTISFPNSFATVKMTIYDEGLATPGGGMRRNATSSNQDPQGLQREYHTAWTPTWYQTYRDGSRYTWPRPLRGRDGAGRLYSSQVGGYRSALSTAGSNGEQGVTIGNALNGAELLSGSISIQAQSTPASSGGWFRIYWHTNTSSPNSFSPTTAPPNYIDYLVLSGGQTGRLPLPQACLDAIKNGTFGGFSFHPGGSTQGYMGITGLDGRTTAQPILRLRYHR